ncbi:MAG: radical SAM protein [Nitrospirota bacterium]
MAGKKILTRIDYLLTKEKGTIFKDPGGKINICLVYPNTYHIGMSSLGFQGLYTLLNERPDVVCERAFLPDEEDMEEYIRTGTEIISFESKRPLSRFEIIAFSVSFENDYPNILRILELSRIPLRSGQRSRMHPLLIMGGVVAFFNPEPLADFFDFCFIGEAEEMLREFIDAYNNSCNREDLYKRAVGIEGLYIPKFYDVKYFDDNKLSGRAGLNNAPEKIKRRFIKSLDENRLRPSIMTNETEFSNMYLVEAMRGCPWSCRFCATGYIFNPPRRKSSDILKRDINETLSNTSRVGLIGPSLTDYPYITDILCIDGVDFSITSLRASRKSAEIMRSLKGHKSISIAPEAGTERLRRAIDKKITNEDIIETSRLILREGIENLRLYFMVGLPTEEDRDIEGLISLVKTIRSSSDKGNLVLTLSTFIPKPFTPFQWHPMEKTAIVKNRLQMIKKSLTRLGGVRVFHDVQKYAYMQGLFSRGDRRVSHVIEGMGSGNDWQKACRESGIKADFYLFRNFDFHDMLPWEFIDNGTPVKKLWAEYQEALAT